MNTNSSHTMENMQLSVAIPCDKLEDVHICELIEEAARSIAGAGSSQAPAIDASEITSNYPFLADKSSDEYRYYSWLLCKKACKLSEEDEVLVKEQYIDSFLNFVPGGVDLLDHDKHNLLKLLADNNGTKEKVKSIRRWVLDRSHSMIAIGIMLSQHVDQVKQNQSSKPYEAILHTIYVINDILFNGSNASMNGVYIRGLSQQTTRTYPPVNTFQCIFLRLGPILKAAYDCASSDIDHQKLFKIIELWQTKEFIIEVQKKGLENLMTGVVPAFPPPSPPLASPIDCIRNILQPYMLRKAPLAGTTIDLGKTSVGVMANIAKASIAQGRPAYHPIDPNTIMTVPKLIEPARLDARVEEFYKKLHGV
jgi:hypothetical protein